MRYSTRVGLIKTRPGISLFAPGVLSRDTLFRVRVILDCAETVPMDELRVELVCTGISWTHSSKGGRSSSELQVWRAAACPVTESVELPQGQHEYAAWFTVPKYAPHSYEGADLQVRWSFRVRADIPWWPDAKASFVATVAAPVTGSKVGDAKVFTSSQTGPVGKKPYAEISMGDVVAGETVRGRIALSNTQHNRYEQVEFALIATETVWTFFGKETKVNKVRSWTLPADGVGENEPMLFGLDIPEGVVPGFETQRLKLCWSLEVRLCVAWAVDSRMYIPLDVVVPQSGTGKEVAVPRAVGSDRLAGIWADVGRQFGYSMHGDQLVRGAGTAMLVVQREHQGRKGLRLVGRASFDDLDLGLCVERGALKLRDAAQSEVLARHTASLTESLTVDSADDEHLRVVLDDAGINRRPVIQVAKGLVELWTAIEAAREELPPPADMADAVDAFRRASRRLGGELDVASMDIRGSRFEVPFALEVQWGADGEPARTMLQVEPAVPIDGRFQHTWLPGERPQETPDGLEALLEGARSLTITAESIRIVFPPCGAEVDRYVERLEGLLEVARRLSGHRPGYR